MTEGFQIARRLRGCEILGFGPTTADKHVREGLLPKLISVGARAKGWPVHELYAINRARAAGWSDERIRELVRELERARQEQAPTVAEAA